MNIDRTRIIRTNRLSTTLTVAVITLVMGVIIGGAGAEIGSSIPDLKKANNTMLGTVSSSTQNTPQPGSVDEWNPFQQIRNMQAQMDRMFNQMNERFQSEPGLSGFADTPGYSLSLDVRDLKDHYEVHAWLPDARASDVHVSLKNDQTLKVEVNSQHTVKSANLNGTDTNAVTRVAEWGQYEQEVQLPTPVKADQMKISRNGHELTITIPKKS